VTGIRVYLAIFVVAALATAGVAVAAVLDHTHPGPSTHAEWTAAWYCAHRHERCGEPEPWHLGWHQREPYYDAGFAGAATVAALFLLASASRARQRAPYNPRRVGRRADLA
jgi:hypothetical protein